MSERINHAPPRASYTLCAVLLCVGWAMLFSNSILLVMLQVMSL